MAVSTSDNGVKILANADGLRLLRAVENRAFDASRVTSAAIVKVPVFFLILLDIPSLAPLLLPPYS